MFDAPQPLVGRNIEDVRCPVPVVADEQHVAQGAARRGGDALREVGQRRAATTATSRPRRWTRYGRFMVRLLVRSVRYRSLHGRDASLRRRRPALPQQREGNSPHGAAETPAAVARATSLARARERGRAWPRARHSPPGGESGRPGALAGSQEAGGVALGRGHRAVEPTEGGPPRFPASCSPRPRPISKTPRVRARTRRVLSTASSGCQVCTRFGSRTVAPQGRAAHLARPEGGHRLRGQTLRSRSQRVGRTQPIGLRA